ncbi:hypothetical protein [Marinoscillum sp. 108]|uniref:hypothetical protein n=1 Tax=Marinoscillum sp. 108 TaxID=2653151 RepID=UPI0012EF40F4|nr:hypothetical protein [Marinoscillum sp. 108]VXD13353.1 conserved hypothetical protein [Marinoscillum sp. 108]
MSSKIFQYAGTLVFLISILFVAGLFTQTNPDHPSLNETSAEPDLYLSNVRHYAKEQLAERSLHHLDKAIESIKKIETDIDVNSKQKVDEAIVHLEMIYEEIVRDSLVSEDLNKAFEFALNALTLAELRISERYAESNNPVQAMVALKYAQMHLKSASQYSDLPNMNLERHIYYEIDSLILSEAMAPVLIAEKIDYFISEMDTLVND